jgi:hypothetical protein
MIRIFNHRKQRCTENGLSPFIRVSMTPPFFAIESDNEAIYHNSKGDCHESLSRNDN